MNLLQFNLSVFASLFFLEKEKMVCYLILGFNFLE